MDIKTGRNLSVLVYIYNVCVCVCVCMGVDVFVCVRSNVWSIRITRAARFRLPGLSIALHIFISISQLFWMVTVMHQSGPWLCHSHNKMSVGLIYRIVDFTRIKSIVWTEAAGVSCVISLPGCFPQSTVTLWPRLHCVGFAGLLRSRVKRSKNVWKWMSCEKKLCWFHVMFTSTCL